MTYLCEKEKVRKNELTRGKLRLIWEDGPLNRNILKIIAAVSMVIDHIGYSIYPDNDLFRIIGRIAFPVFVFFIYEGCKFTRNRFRYLGQVAGLGAVCLLVYYLYTGEIYGNILITFSLSIINLAALGRLRQSIRKSEGQGELLKNSCLFAACILGTFLICRAVPVDYGFWGVMVPVLTALTEFLPVQQNRYLPILGFTAGLLLLAADLGGIQYYSLLAVPLLLLYNGKRGKYRMKYFFYLFYPLHLAAIELLAAVL